MRLRAPAEKSAKSPLPHDLLPVFDGGNPQSASDLTTLTWFSPGDTHPTRPGTAVVRRRVAMAVDTAVRRAEPRP